MNSIESPSEYKRQTDKLSDAHKSSIDKMCKDMNCDEMNHASNHIMNMHDKLSKHAHKEVTMADYMKAKKNDPDMDGDSPANDADKDGM